MKHPLIFLLICYSLLKMGATPCRGAADSLKGLGYYALKEKAVRLYDKQKNYRCLIVAGEMMELAGGDSLQVAIAHYTKGAAYNQLRNYQEAYSELSKALDYFRNTKEYDYLGQTYGELARLRFYRGDMEGSLGYYSTASANFKKAQNNKQLYKVRGNKGIVQGQMGNFRKGIDTFRAVKKLALANGDSLSVIPVYLNIGQAFLRNGQPDSARAYLQRAVTMSHNAQEPMLRANGLNSLANYYFSKGDYQRSNELGQEALGIYREHKAMRRSGQILQRLSSAHSKLGNYRQSNNLLWQYANLKDSLHNANNEKAIAEVEGKLLLNEKENSIALLQAQTRASQRKQMLYLSLFALAVAITAIATIKLRKSRKLRRAQIAVHEKQMELENAKQDKLQSELDLKVRSLTREGLRIIQKNNQLEELQSRLDALAHKIPKSSGSALQAIRSSLQYAFSVDKDWDEFSVYFEEVHPQFLEKLTRVAPALTHKEKRLCALLRVNMNTKEMASVLGISPDSVKKARNRLRKKLPLTHTDALSAYLQHV